jgi:antitoxin component YwqK of YwqJK toxin-antitoxin module
MLSRLRFLFLFLFFPAGLAALTGDPLDPFAYEPGVANPLGPYLLQDGLKGPLMLIALNEKGQIVETSRIRYDEKGRIQSESFYDDRNNFTGEIRYTFEKGVPVKEEYFDAKGESVSTKTRQYMKGRVSRIDVHNGKTLQLVRSYSYTRDRIAVRETVDRISDVFHITLDEKGRPMKMELADEERKPLQQISYSYDEKGRLKERIKTLPDSAFRCLYEYDETGRLYQYIYFDKKGKDWIKTKTIRLIYPDRV